jgi:hypothetical protein
MADDKKPIHPYSWGKVVHIPNLFFDFNPESNDKKIAYYLKIIKDNINNLNLSASGKSFQNDGLILYALRWLWQELQEALKISKSCDNPQKIMLYVLANLSLFLISDFNVMGIVTDCKYLEDVIAFLSNLQISQLTPELAWYYACSVHMYSERNNSYTHEKLVDHLIKAVQHIGNYDQHKSEITMWIIQLIQQAKCYPKKEWFDTLNQYCKKCFTDHPDFNFDGECAQTRHAYVDQIKKNKEYFKFEDSQALTSDTTTTFSTAGESFSKEAGLVIGNCLKIPARVLTPRYLVTFAAHLAPPVNLLELTVDNLTDERLKQINLTFKQKLRSLGMCTSNGILIKVDQVNFKTVQKALVETFDEENLFTNETVRYNWLEENFTFAKIAPWYNQCAERIKSLSGFDSLEALYLCYKCLVECEYGLPKNLLEIAKRTVFTCLEIATEAKKIADQKDTPRNKATQWLDLAGKIVNYLTHKKQSLLIAVGTPIEEGTNSSTHAIYVVLKYLKDTNQYQIIITNGGLGVSTFHSLSKTLAPKDNKIRAEYNYAAFKPFTLGKDLNDQYYEALRYYIYKLISLEFTPAINSNGTTSNDKVSNSNSSINFDALLKDIYLREANDSEDKEFFTIYEPTEQKMKPIKVFKRVDLQQHFSAQITGNCTVYNMENALSIMLDMNQATYGLLGDNLVLGFDQFITSLLQPQPSPSSSSSSSSSLSPSMQH